MSKRIRQLWVERDGGAQVFPRFRPSAGLQVGGSAIISCDSVRRVKTDRRCLVEDGLFLVSLEVVHQAAIAIVFALLGSHLDRVGPDGNSALEVAVALPV